MQQSKPQRRRLPNISGAPAKTQNYDRACVRALLPKTFFLIFVSKVLNCVLMGVVRTHKKPLGIVRKTKKVIVPSPFFFSLASSFRFFLKAPPEVRPPPSGVPSAPLNAMQCRKGPKAVRIGHTATFASLNLRLRRLEEAKRRGKGPGPGPKAEQRLSRCMALTQKQQISD